jgi:hypothetical protein
MTDTTLPSQWSPLVVQNIDLDHTRDSQGTPQPAVLGRSLAPTIRGGTLAENRNVFIPPLISSDAAAAINITTLLNALAEKLPSSQEKRGNDELGLACEIADTFKSVITERDKRTIEDKIIL